MNLNERKTLMFRKIKSCFESVRKKFANKLDFESVHGFPERSSFRIAHDDVDRYSISEDISKEIMVFYLKYDFILSGRFKKFRRVLII